MLGKFKLDHLLPFEPILSQKIFNFFSFILGGQFLLPQKANMEKREFIQLQNWMRQRGLGAFTLELEGCKWSHLIIKIQEAVVTSRWSFFRISINSNSCFQQEGFADLVRYFPSLEASMKGINNNIVTYKDELRKQQIFSDYQFFLGGSIWLELKV